jgi:hypothetical protein
VHFALASAYLRPDRSTSSFASPPATRSLRVLRRTCSGSLLQPSLALMAEILARPSTTLEDLCSSPARAGPYQDDFETPGISPRNANCRKHSRHMPNFRRKPRGRPQNLQRLCFRVENLGFLGLSWCSPTPSLTRFAVVAIHFLHETRNLKLLCPERHSHMLQQRPRLVIIRRSRHDCHVHALQLVDLLIRNLREDQLIV